MEIAIKMDKKSVIIAASVMGVVLGGWLALRAYNNHQNQLAFEAMWNQQQRVQTQFDKDFKASQDRFDKNFGNVDNPAKPAPTATIETSAQ
jgi:uncharacterized membrane protein YebE (DUF533 family)